MPVINIGGGITAGNAGPVASAVPAAVVSGTLVVADGVADGARIVSAIDASMPVASTRTISVGRAASDRNQGDLSFFYAGPGSANNYVAAGLHNNPQLYITPGGVGVGTSIPAAALDVVGNVRASNGLVGNALNIGNAASVGGALTVNSNVTAAAVVTGPGGLTAVSSSVASPPTVGLYNSANNNGNIAVGANSASLAGGAFWTDDGSFSTNFNVTSRTPGNATNAMVSRLYVASNGNVGFGTTAPVATLDVRGGIRAPTATLDTVTSNNLSVSNVLTLSALTTSNATCNNLAVSNSATVAGTLGTTSAIAACTTVGDPGDLISKVYGVADRYGLGQYTVGRTRVVTSSTYAPASVGFALCGNTAANVQGNAAAGGIVDLLVANASSIQLLQPTAANALTVTNGASVGGALSANALAVSNSASVGGPLSANVLMVSNTASVTGTLSANALTVSNSASVTGTLTSGALSTTGNVTAGRAIVSGNLSAASAALAGGLTATGAIVGSGCQATGYTAPPSQGAYLAWNRSSTGVSAFVNQQGGGTGGYEWINYNSAGNITAVPATLSAAGDLSALRSVATGNVTASNVAVAGALSVTGGSTLAGTSTGALVCNGFQAQVGNAVPILFAGPGANGAQLITDFSTFPVTYGGSGNGVVPTVRLQVTDTGATTGPYTGVMNLQQCLANATSMASRVFMNASGQIGFGTTTPTTGYIVDIAGGLRTTGTNFQQASTAGYYLGSALSANNAGFITFNAGTPSATNSLGLGIWGQPTGITVAPTGNVGIGATSPAYSLDLTGNMRLTGGMSFNNQIQNQMLSLYSSDAYLNPSSTNYYGLGVNNFTMRYQVPSGGQHTWYANTTQLLNLSNSALAVTGPILQGTSTDTSRAISCLNSAMANATTSYITLGQSASTNNQAELSFTYAGSGSANNAIGLGVGGSLALTCSSTKTTVNGNLAVTGNIKTSGFSYDQPLSATYYTNTNLTLSATTPANFPANTWSGYSTNAQTGSITFSNAGDITIPTNGVWSISFSTLFSTSAADNRVWLVNRTLSGGVLNPNQDQLAGIMGGPLGYATATWTGYFAANTLITPVMYSNVSQSVGGTTQARLNITRVTVCN